MASAGTMICQAATATTTKNVFMISNEGVGMRFGMGCEAQTTAIAWLLRGFATTQTARSRARTPMRRS